jgi:glycosyltransferase involved in cell wall biosynthesis
MKLQRWAKIFLSPKKSLKKLLTLKKYTWGSLGILWQWRVNLQQEMRAGRKVLFFVDWKIPEPDQDAGSFVAFQYLKILRDLGFSVVFWPRNRENSPYAQSLVDLGIRVCLDRVSPAWFSRHFGKFFDLVFLSRPDSAQDWMKSLRSHSGARIVYLGHDLHFLREARRVQLQVPGAEGRQEIEALKKRELSLVETADLSLFFSDKEVEILHSELPLAKAGVLPWIEPVHTELANLESRLSSRRDIVFLGGFSHSPNVDAVLWLYREIYPLLKTRLADFRIVILGSHVSEVVAQLHEEQFQVLGFVPEENLSECFFKARVFVAPLRYGAGFKGKTAKAMSWGVPVVTTNVGAEGVGLVHGSNALIADDAESFARQILVLFQDDQTWQKFAAASLSHASKAFSPVQGRAILENYLQPLVQPR